MTQISSKKLSILGALLLAQVALAMVLFWQGQQQAQVTVEPLLALEDNRPNKMIVQGNNIQIEVLKQDGRWRTSTGLPVPDDLMESMFNRFQKIKTGWPAASTVSAHKRFEVDDDTFQRKVSFYNGEQQIGGVYLGSSVSYKQVHVRRFGDDNIYTADMNIYDVPTELGSWIDTALLQPAGDIQALAVAGKTLAKQDGEWPAENPENTAQGSPESNEDKATMSFDAAAFVSALQDLRVMGVADSTAGFDTPDASDAANTSDEKPSKMTFSVTTDKGELTYELLQNGSDYFIRRNDYSVTFRLSQSQFETLASIAHLPA